MFPFTIQQVEQWGISDPDIAPSILTDNDRFAATWLKEHKEKLSIEAQNVINAASILYQFYFKNLNYINTSQFLITTWDAGIYQIRKSLQDAELGDKEIKDLADANNLLANKIRSRVRELGFMR